MCARPRIATEQRIKCRFSDGNEREFHTDDVKGDGNDDEDDARFLTNEMQCPRLLGIKYLSFLCYLYYKYRRRCGMRSYTYIQATWLSSVAGASLYTLYSRKGINMQIIMTKNNQFLKLGCRVENLLQQFFSGIACLSWYERAIARIFIILTKCQLPLSTNAHSVWFVRELAPSPLSSNFKLTTRWVRSSSSFLPF